MRAEASTRPGSPAMRSALYDVPTDEERAARREAYTERDRAASRQQEVLRQAARATDAARQAVEVAKVRSEVRLGILRPPGTLAAADMGSLLITGPLGSIGCPERLLRCLAGPGGPWEASPAGPGSRRRMGGRSGP